MVPTSPPADKPLPALLTAQDVATELQCCEENVRRMAATGLMPAALKIGKLSRWARADVEAWIQSGCPRVESAKMESAR